MQKKEFLKYGYTIWVCTCLILWVFQWYVYINATFLWNTPNTTLNQEYSDNKQKFQSAYVSNYASVWVALSTRIGISFSEKSGQYSHGGYYKQVIDLWNTQQEKKSIRNKLISQNIIFVREYLNLSKSNIVDLLKSSNNRQKTLESFIHQLEYRGKNAKLSMQNLELQKADLLKQLNSVSEHIENIKQSMQQHFTENNPDAVNSDVDTYFALRAEYTELFTDIVFINQFLKQYAFLNTYNAGILNTLKTNKQAIINQSYVVIPESGGKYLKPLELIFDEAELKAIKKTEE